MPGLTSARSLISSSRSNLSLNGYKFPDDIEKVPHKLVMRFVKRSATQGGRSDLTPQQVTRTNGYIVLPVPTQIVDGVSLNYKATDLGITGEIIAGGASAIATAAGSLDFSSLANFGSSLSASANVISTTASQFGSYGSAAGQAMAQYYGAAVINGILQRAGVNSNAAAALAVGLNKTLNPFTTAVFEGVNLRRFKFNWTLSPKSRNESTNLEDIIRMLRSKSLPTISRGTAGIFMEFPDTVEFNIVGMESDTFTFPTAPCVIDSITFDRTPTGSPVFFAGTGAPAIIQINMSLMEIKPLIRDDTGDYQVGVNSFLAPPTGAPGSATTNPTSGR